MCQLLNVDVEALHRALIESSITAVAVTAVYEAVGLRAEDTQSAIPVEQCHSPAPTQAEPISAV